MGRPVPNPCYTIPMQQTHLPESFRSLFWDVPFSDLTVSEHAHMIMKRILDRGNTEQVRWLLKTYPKKDIRAVVMGTRDLARATGHFWADFLDINKQDVPCLQKPYNPIHFGLSS